MTLVLDSGALIALERNDRAMWRRLKATHLAGRVPVSHGGVVGQAWRGRGPRQALLAKALAATDILPLDETLGRAAGELLATAKRHDVIDAALVLLASDGALSSAVRTTLVGSMMPALSRSSYSSVAALKPKAPFPFFTLSSTIEPSAPALFAIQRSGSSIAFFTILTPKRSSSETSSLSSTALARMSATPPPGTMPS